MKFPSPEGIPDFEAPRDSVPMVRCEGSATIVNPAISRLKIGTSTRFCPVCKRFARVGVPRGDKSIEVFFRHDREA